MVSTFSLNKLEHFENHSLAWKVAYHFITNTNGSSSQTEIYKKDDLWWFSLFHLSVSTRTEMELWLYILKKTWADILKGNNQGPPDIEWPFSAVNVMGGRFDRTGPIACLSLFPVLVVEKVQLVTPQFWLLSFLSHALCRYYDNFHLFKDFTCVRYLFYEIILR